MKRPLATSTKVNVVDTPPEHSPKKTFKNNDDVVAIEDSPKRRGGRKSQRKAAPPTSKAESGRKASGRVSKDRVILKLRNEVDASKAMAKEAEDKRERLASHLEAIKE